MSIGTLGSAGDQFRDFLGGAQQDIGQGLQSVLSNYASPNGNFLRLNDRALNMFQLTSSEYQATFDQDAQNSYAESWYAEYRAVLLLRAEALKKKLNRAYSNVLSNSIYAPVRPNEEWAPEANRDVNDIKADDPLEFYTGASIKGPPPPTNTTIDSTKYLHPEWFSGSDAYSGGEGNAYDDIRSYINGKYPLSDMDGDDRIIEWRPGDLPADDPFDGEYDLDGENNTNPAYYNLWRTGDPFGPGPYDLATVYNPGTQTYANSWYEDITIENNVPPSTVTQNFVASGDPTHQYYIEIPDPSNSLASTTLSLLPSFVTSNDLAGSPGLFDNTGRSALIAAGVSPADILPTVPAGNFYLRAGTKFYDPNYISTQGLFPGAGSPVGDTDGLIGGLDMNDDLIGPAGPGASLVQNDATSTGSPSIKSYQEGFVDSWFEARQLQKREAQIEAAYTAYLEGKAAIDASYAAKGKTSWSYQKMMDQVFVAIDGIGGSGGPMPPGAPPPVPGDVPNTNNPMNPLMPYGYYLFPGNPIPKHPAVNSPNYDVGSAFTPGSPQSTDPGSVYRLIYDRLALAADPTQITGGNSGTDALNDAPQNPSTTVYPPATPTVPDTSHLYAPIPIGASEGREGGPTQPNINSVSGTDELEDTTHLAPGHAATLANISNLFVGRQWDYSPGFDQDSNTTVSGSENVAPVKYEAETISSHLMVLPGWWYDASGQGKTDGDNVGKALLTMTPAIEGLTWQKLANRFGLGMIDDYVNSLLGGPFFHVGGGSDSLGIYDIDGSSTQYSVGVGFGMGIGGIYWGHTSALGTVGRLDELLDNSGVDENKPDDRGGGWAYEIMKTSLGVLSGLGGEPVDDFSLFPNVGLAGFHFDFNIPIPIPPPVGLSWLNIPMTTYGAASYDILTDVMYRYLDGMKHEVVDSLSVYSYATSGGYAMDSYGLRGEYQFTEKTAFESIKKMPDLFGIVPMADMIEMAVGLLGLEDYEINNYDLKEEGIFKGDQMHSMNAAEARELDTGAFFTTAAFLSQFQLSDLSYTYWTGTHQNEEVANMDTLRLVSLTGKEMMKFLNKALFTVAGRIDWDGPLAAVTLSVLNFMLAGFQQGVNEAMMWDILMHDQDEQGFVTTIKITQSSLKSEGYDFIEDERKLFAYDYEQTTKKGIMQTAVASAFGSFELPNQVMSGLANTRRYKPYLQGVDGRAGRQGWGGADALDTANEASVTQGPGAQPKVHTLIRHSVQTAIAAGNSTEDTLEFSGGTFEVGDEIEILAHDGPHTVTIQSINGDILTFDPPITNAPDPGEPYVVIGSQIINHTGENRYDDNWDIKAGFWEDTGLGDINEVYVRKNTVTYTDSITHGLSGTVQVSGTMDPDLGITVTTTVDRYVGSHNRIIGRSYDPANPLNLQSFRTGYFASRYFGSYISEGTATDDMVVYDIDGTVDGREGVTVRMHGGQKYYDRKNDYEFSVTTADGTSVNLTRQSALAPVFGGRMKIATIDQDNPNQPFGASTTGQTNELTETLYHYMRVNAEGTNAQLVREYRDVFNLGLLDDIFITASANAPTGGGVTSSVRIKFRNVDDDPVTPLQYGAYEAARNSEVVGSSLMQAEPGYLGERNLFKNTNRSIADVYLSSFFAFKRQPKTQAG